MFIELIGKDDTLKNVHDEIIERKKAFKELKQKLFPRVRQDPIVAAMIANGTKSSDPEFRKVFKQTSARIIKEDGELQKVVAKARFGFDPVWSKLSEEQRVKLLNLLNDNENAVILPWRSSRYLKLTV